MADARLAVLVPVKPLAQAKSRLSPLPDDTRQAIVATMLSRVLRAIAEARTLLEVVMDCRVLTDDPVVERVAAANHASAQIDGGRELNASLTHAMQGRFEEGARAALYLGADLPLVVAADIARIVEASGMLAHPAAVRAARDGGTNALLLPGGLPMRLAFGPDSFQRHVEAANEAGATLASVDVPSIAFDVDTMDDLSWALDNIEGFADEVEAAKALFARHARSAH